MFSIAVAAQGKEREGVIPITLLRASLLDSIARPIAAMCSVAHRVWHRAPSQAHFPNAHAPGQVPLRQFAQWESVCRLSTTPLCVS